MPRGFVMLLLAGVTMVAAAAAAPHSAPSTTSSCTVTIEPSTKVNTVDRSYVSFCGDSFDKQLNKGLGCFDPAASPLGGEAGWAAALAGRKGSGTIMREYSDGLCYRGFGPLTNRSGACAGAAGVLSSDCLANYLDFAEGAGLRLLLGLNAEWGRNLTSSPPRLMTWDPSQATELLGWLAERQSPALYAIEVGNECNCYGNKGKIPGALLWRDHGPATMAGDYKHVRALIDELWPEKATRPLLAGPAISFTGDTMGRCGYEQTPEEVVGFFERFLEACGTGVLDVANWHWYPQYAYDHPTLPNSPQPDIPPRAIIAMGESTI